MTAAQIVVIAKEPVPGKVKTRLAPAYGSVGAAALALAALQDTVDACLAADCARVVVALDGRPGDWLADGVTVIGQHAGGLGDRLAWAIADAYEGLAVPVLVVGMDTPQVTAGLLDTVLARLVESGVDAVLGPADDGGYWCIGLRTPDDSVFDDVPMSLPTTGSAQRARLAALHLRTAEVPGLRDVDLPSDVPLVALQAPGTRFARLAQRVDSGAA